MLGKSPWFHPGRAIPKRLPPPPPLPPAAPPPMPPAATAAPAPTVGRDANQRGRVLSKDQLTLVRDLRPPEFAERRGDTQINTRGVLGPGSGTRIGIAGGAGGVDTNTLLILAGIATLVALELRG